MKKIYSIFELFKIIQKRPWMYLWEKQTLTNLLGFLAWYSFWIWDDNKKLLNKLFYKFQDYIVEKTVGMDNRTNDCWMFQDCLLKVSDGNEEKAFYLFFELLDNFIEKERIVIDISSPVDLGKS